MVTQQLEQTQAKMSVWDVLVHSTRHREGLIQALSHLKVSSGITPDELVALIKTIPIKHAITFTDRDLPSKGTDHNKPLHLTLKCHGKWVPVILIDNGLAINVCPFRVAYCLGYKKKDFSPSEVKVQAYDNTRRDVVGTLMLPMTFGSYQTKVQFHVKIRLGLETGMLTIHRDSGIRAPTEDNAPLLEIQHGEEDIALEGFSLDTSNVVFSVRIDDDFVISNVAIKIMKKMSYMPSLGLGKNLQGPAKFEARETLIRTTGLGYSPSNGSKTNKGDRLEDYFVKEKTKQVYQGQLEPFWDKETNTLLPGFEIFANDVWPENEEEFKAEKVPGKPTDWIEVFNMRSLAVLFKEDEPMWSDAESKSESESSESSESVESELVPLGPTPHGLYFEFESTCVYGAPEAFASDEINESDFAYFPDFRINCVDPDDEEIDFDGDCQALTSLLKEFEDVFVWSHADMPGIDPEIVGHQIPLYPDAKPVKQKLRRMRPDWVLKIKEEVTKQINARFLMVTEYPQWVANIVPVPKRDGRIRVCVDFRDLNKASSKDDFPLPHIDVLVDNTAGHALLSFMDGFSGYNQILMAPEDREKTTFVTEWGTYCYRVMPFGLKNAGST
ncbi:uncharacterized protein LOC131321189 [Rhododendron vialii]|uniref:uncharacterized protein LOC131321189 n=1 Tax=Rhododendron vialii TaxID=182163 RepID=UPI00265F826C|nr:uncharacterized protein LOC131321189 [Rhododendron vialii]